MSEGEKAQITDGTKAEGKVIAAQPIDAEDDSADEFNKVIKDAPPEFRKVINRMFAMQISSRQESGPLPAKFLESVGEKITEKHIDSIIGNSDKGDRRQFCFSVLIQIRNFLIILGAIGCFIWLTVYLSKDRESLYLDLVKTIVTFLGGLGLGYGIKGYKSKSK